LKNDLTEYICGIFIQYSTPSGIVRSADSSAHWIAIHFEFGKISWTEDSVPTSIQCFPNYGQGLKAGIEDWPFEKDF
jgi:hypothetical protein